MARNSHLQGHHQLSNDMPVAHRISRPSRVGTPYLTFSAGGTVYSLNIVGTQAIIDSHRCEPIENQPEFVRGVHDWHGIRLPVIDLSSRLGFPMTKHPRNAVIVVAEFWTEQGGFLVGVEVCNVREVLFLNQDEYDVPDASTNMHSAFMDALSRAQDHYAMVVHPSQLLTPDEAALLAELAECESAGVTH